MEIIRYFESEAQPKWLEAIASCHWSAASFLTGLLKNGTFHETLGGWGHLLLLTEGDSLVSFLTLTGQDAVRDETMVPWVGFVFTEPAYRGRHYAGMLLEYAERIAAQDGYRKVYIATDHIGLYEKYGYVYMENRIDCWGDDVRVLYKSLVMECDGNARSALV